jgi:hypothetical protein
VRHADAGLPRHPGPGCTCHWRSALLVGDVEREPRTFTSAALALRPASCIRAPASNSRGKLRDRRHLRVQEFGSVCRRQNAKPSLRASAVEPVRSTHRGIASDTQDRRSEIGRKRGPRPSPYSSRLWTGRPDSHSGPFETVGRPLFFACSFQPTRCPPLPLTGHYTLLLPPANFLLRPPRFLCGRDFRTRLR